MRLRKTIWLIFWLLHKLQRGTSPKNLLKPLPFCDLRTRKADAYKRLLAFFCVACAKKMPLRCSVLLNAYNIRLLTKCDAALLSFRYTSFIYFLRIHLSTGKGQVRMMTHLSTGQNHLSAASGHCLCFTLHLTFCTFLFQLTWCHCLLNFSPTCLLSTMQTRW